MKIDLTEARVQVPLPNPVFPPTFDVRTKFLLCFMVRLRVGCGFGEQKKCVLEGILGKIAFKFRLNMIYNHFKSKSTPN